MFALRCAFVQVLTTLDDNSPCLIKHQYLLIGREIGLSLRPPPFFEDVVKVWPGVMARKGVYSRGTTLLPRPARKGVLRFD